MNVANTKAIMAQVSKLGSKKAHHVKIRSYKTVKVSGKNKDLFRLV